MTVFGPPYDRLVAGAVRRDVPVVGVVAAGGVAGALARYGLGLAFPHPRTGFPWATFGINVSGCLLIGLLVVLVTEGPAAHPLTRPFLGTGVLGGYTTFSTAMVDTQHLWSAGAAGTGLAYLFGTLAAALAAVWLGVLAMRWWLTSRGRRAG
jgi:CrcB protein